MRRLIVLLSVAAAAVVGTAPAAQAYPICAIAWTEGTVAPHVSTGQTCAGYPYGVLCHKGHTYFDPEVHVYFVVCHPL